MTRIEHTHAQILAELGNHDREDNYPKPLECLECGTRPRGMPPTPPGREETVWYWVVGEPMPEGWRIVEDRRYPLHQSTLCPTCYAAYERGEDTERPY